MNKAEAFLRKAEALGCSGKQKGETVTLEHAGFVMVMRWSNGVYDYGGSKVSVKGQERTIRNAAQALRYLSGSEKPFATNGNGHHRAAKPKAPPKSAPTPARELPPDEPAPSAPERMWKLRSAPDKEILAAVIGKEVFWYNQSLKRVESARVSSNPNQKMLKIDRNRRKERCLTFASVIGPREELGAFRSVLVTNIVKVIANKGRKEADKQE